MSTLTGGTEDTDFTITYATLLAAADEADVDGDPLSFRIETVSSGTLTKGGIAVVPGTTLLGSGENLIWTPALNVYGVLDAFTVKVWDGLLASADPSVQVRVEVTAVNDAPVVTDIPGQTFPEGSVFSGIPLDDYVSDIDNTDAEMVWSYSGNTDLTISIDINRVATITLPDLDWNGSETITFRATDPGGSWAEDVATFTITAEADSPVVTDIPGQTFPEGSVFSGIPLDDYVSDIDNTDAEMVWSYSGNTDLTVSIDINRVATITLPDLDWNGSETITFRATDPGGSWAEDVATFTITAEADSPVVTDIPGQTFPEGSVFSGIPLDDYVSDIDNTDAEMVWSYSGNTDLTVSIDINRVATITLPDLDWNGSETITFRATDPGGSWAEDVATFTITAEADSPVVTDIPGQTFPEGSVFSGIPLDDYVSDIDNTDAEMVWSYSGNTDLTVSIDINRVATITLPDLDWNGSETITFRATDPGGSWAEDVATFTITAEADSPVVTDIPGQTFPEGSVFSGIPLDDYVSDIDNTDAEMVWSYSGNTDLTVSIDINRVATITLPDLDWNGSETITFRATDPGGSWAEDVATFTITAEADSPVVTDIPGQTFPEGSVFSGIPLDDYVSDIDNTDAEMVWSYSGNTDLTVSIDINRVATITLPDLDWNGSETITFRATDPGGSWAEDVATFTITAEADSPVVTDIPGQTFPEGSVFSGIPLDDYVSDVDNTDAEMVWSYSGNTDLTVSIDINRVATIGLVNADWNGTEAITFTATDQGGASDSDVATFEVTAVNDAPVVSDIEDQTIAEGGSFTTISLDGYVTDAETADADILWTTSTPVNLTVTIVDRVATIGLVNADWNGTEAITFTATDQGGASDSDVGTFTVTNVITIPPGWEVNPPDFNHSGQITAKVYINQSAIESGFLAAFVGEECRGIADTSYFPPSDHFVYSLMFYSNNAVGDTLTFKYYDPVEDRIYKMDTSFVFIPDMIVGNAITPKLMYDGIDYNELI